MNLLPCARLKEPVDPRLADTQHFQVLGLSQASQDEALDDVETDLQHILEGQEHDVPEAAKKRRQHARCEYSLFETFAKCCSIQMRLLQPPWKLIVQTHA